MKIIDTNEHRITDSGTYYHRDALDAVIHALELCRENRRRVRVWYGDTNTGRSWDEEHDTIGYVGRSTGQHKIPLLVYNQRSFGGGAVVTDKIIKIVDVKKHLCLYQHPKFHQSYFQARKREVWQYVPSDDGIGYQLDGTYAICKTEEQAKRLADFMNGKRHNT